MHPPTVSFPRVRKAGWDLQPGLTCALALKNRVSTRNSAATAVHKFWLPHWERKGFFSGDFKRTSSMHHRLTIVSNIHGLVKWRHARRRAKISALWGLTSGCFMSHARLTWFGMWQATAADRKRLEGRWKQLPSMKIVLTGTIRSLAGIISQDVCTQLGNGWKKKNVFQERENSVAALRGLVALYCGHSAKWWWLSTVPRHGQFVEDVKPAAHKRGAVKNSAWKCLSNGIADVFLRASFQSFESRYSWCFGSFGS